MTATLLAPPVADDISRCGLLTGLGAAGLLTACSAQRGPDPVGGDGFPRTVRHAGGDLERFLGARPDDFLPA